ncbi:MAG: GIY-YIG nuclease family protein [bacterium]|nr:GIY-YIG nuclease family protein [bacterium]
MKNKGHKESKYIVYIYTNKYNNKKYVGMTNQSLKARRGNKQFADYRNCTEFYGAIQKYGADAFESRIVGEFMSTEQAEELEKRLIAMLRTQDEAFGYNLRAGGKGGKHSNKTKERIGRANKGKVVSLDQRKQISEANSVKVVCLDQYGNFITVYDSLVLASKAVGVHKSGISKCCKGINRTAGGYRWKYEIDYQRGICNRVA